MMQNEGSTPITWIQHRIPRKTVRNLTQPYKLSQASRCWLASWFHSSSRGLFLECREITLRVTITSGDDYT